MREDINLNIREFSEEEKQKDVTPSEAHQIAAKAFYDRLLYDSKQLDNMRYYCREMGRKLPCDVDPTIVQTGPSKDLRVRYGLNYSDNNVVWSILEDWFKNKIEPQVIVTVEDINKHGK